MGLGLCPYLCGALRNTHSNAKILCRGFDTGSLLNQISESYKSMQLYWSSGESPIVHHASHVSASLYSRHVIHSRMGRGHSTLWSPAVYINCYTSTYLILPNRETSITDTDILQPSFIDSTAYTWLLLLTCLY